jgi:hypothetical protein
MKTYLSAVTIVMLGLLSRAEATIILEMSLNQIVGSSDMIFLGQAVKAESRWTADKRHIVTDTTFKVIESYQGATAGQMVVVRHLGGVVDRIGMRVSGTPSFSSREPVVLFTEKRGNARYVVGMRQGAFHVFKDYQGRSFVQSSRTGLVLSQRTTLGLKKVSPQAIHEPQLLGDFAKKVQQAIQLCTKERSQCQIQ